MAFLLLFQPAARAGLWFQPMRGPSGADVNALAPDGATLWAAAYRGVWRLSAGAWTLDGLGEQTVTSVAVADGSVWAATPDGLFRRGADGAWSAETLPPAALIPPSVLAGDGSTLWAGGLGLLRRSGGTWSAMPSPGAGLVTALVPDASGLLVGLSSSAVVRWNGTGFTALGGALGSAEPVQALLPYLGFVYAGTQRALYVFGGAAWTPDAGLGVHDVRAISAAGGVLRVATYDGGVLRNPGGGWTNDRSGLLTLRTKAFATLGSDLYLGTGGGPVYRLSGSAWSDPAPGTLNGTEVTDAIGYQPGTGAIFPVLATNGAGIGLEGAPALPDGCGDVSAVSAAPQGQGLLLATGCGALLGLTSFQPAGAGLPAGTRVTSLAETPLGVAGGTTNAGVYRFVGSSWSADNNGLSGSASVGTIRELGLNLFAFANGRLTLRGSNGTWADAGQGLPSGAVVTALGGTSDFGFAGLAAGGVHRRQPDGGWQQDSAGLPASPVSSLETVDGRLYAAGGGSGVLVRADGGFRKESFGLPAGVDARVVRGAWIGSPSLMPSQPKVFVGTAGRGAFSASADSSVRAIPVVLDAGGGAGARFRTELTIGNRGAAARISVVFTPAPRFSGGLASATQVWVDLPANTELRAGDALDFLRSRGAQIPPATPASPIAGSLTLEAFATFSSPPQTERLYAIARTYTAAASGGTYGLFYDAPGDVDAAEETAAVYGLRSVSGKARSNLALVHVPGRGSDPITLSVQVYDAGGNAAGAPIVKSLAPGEWYQHDGILRLAGLPDGSFGYARITRTAGVGSWIAYGVVNDDPTSDGSYLAMQRPGGLGAARRQIVPVVLDVLGAGGSHYTTELTLVNDGPVSTPVDLTYQPAPGFGSVPGIPQITVTVPAHQQVTLADVLQAFRDKGVAVPRAADGGTAGSLAVEFRYLTNLDLGTTLALARTTTPNTDTATGGAFGLFYPAVARGGGSRNSALVPALRQDGAARANLAVVHVRGGSDLPMTVSAQLHDADTGAAVGSRLTATLQPGEWKQWSGVHVLAGVPASVTRTYAVVTRTAGDDSFFAYGVVNDAVTNDGSYVAMIPADRL